MYFIICKLLPFSFRKLCVTWDSLFTSLVDLICKRCGTRSLRAFSFLVAFSLATTRHFPAP